MPTMSVSTTKATVDDGLITARKKAGGPSRLAALLSNVSNPITSQAISQWRRIPAERVLAVEAVTGISRHELRPDLFGPPPSEGAAA